MLSARLCDSNQKNQIFYYYLLKQHYDYLYWMKSSLKSWTLHNTAQRVYR